MIDVRSDTVTTPTAEMRQAMAEAEVGDDVLGDDPTVQRLEELAAAMLGKEAALFVASGTMANLTSLLSHCERGSEVILGQQSHIFLNEVAGMSVVGGLQARTVDDGNGHVAAGEVEAAIRGENIHFPPTRLVCLENTHNRAGGVVMALAEMEAVVDVARAHGLRTHLDGARLFNAATYLGVSPASIAALFDSVYICLSKGLGAPVGSLTCGSREFVERARKYRKMLGGGMRQAGVIAAPGIVALTTMTQRLAQDHRTARRIAEGIADLPGVTVDPKAIETNFAFVEFTRPELMAPRVSGLLRERGIRANANSMRLMRIVTHHQVSMADAEAVVAAFREIFLADLPPMATDAPVTGY